MSHEAAEGPAGSGREGQEACWVDTLSNSSSSCGQCVGAACVILKPPVAQVGRRVHVLTEKAPAK